jgi:hypothetical protein
MQRRTVVRISVSVVATTVVIVLVTGRIAENPFERQRIAGEFRSSIVVWRSEATTGEAEPACAVVAGGSCRFGDPTTAEGYPDVAGAVLDGFTFWDARPHTARRPAARPVGDPPRRRQPVPRRRTARSRRVRGWMRALIRPRAR